MPYCANCGSPVEGRFCPNCGTPVAADQPPVAPPPPGGGPPGAQIAPNVAGALCYIPVFIPAILFLVLEPYSRNKEIRFHAFQALFLQIAWVVVQVVLGVLAPLGGWSLWWTLSRLVHLALVLLALYLMWQTYQNRKTVLPMIGEAAQKYA
ncbi:MAG: hypothetical protein ACUVXB_09120 [Bryobacteraceae bacterium]